MDKKSPKTAKAVNPKALEEVETPTPAAEQAEVENPTPAAEQAEVGQQPEDSKEPTTPAKAKSQGKKKAVPDFLKGYLKAYPNEKVFHVASDHQVFLDKDYNLAKLHQNSLGKGEITTYNL
ncbi:MAG: hypothetical protein K2I87_07210 [Bacteroidales bacterium]|nr:hypothetical protein [Bacteroidales bacterium]